jgi:hypothetical protein
MYRHRRTSIFGSVLVAAALVSACSLPDADARQTPRDAPVTITPSMSASIPSTGSQLFVSPDGNDANPGTEQQPFKSLQKAADVVQAGTTVLVGPGDYGPVVSRRSGTAAARIVFQSTTIGRARIVTTGDTTPWDNRGSYVDIVGFEVSAPRSREGMESDGSFVRFVANHVYDTATQITCTSSGGAGINHAGYADAGNEVIGNWVHDIGPAGCNFVQGIYVSQANGRIVNNVVYRVAAWGIHTWHAATDVVIANNLVFANGTASADNGGGIVVGAGDDPPGVQASNFLVVNNIVMHNYRGIAETGRQGTGNRYVNNLVFNNDTDLDLDRGVELGTIRADPQLVNYRPDGSGDYHLGPASPALDAGTADGAPAVAIDGAARPLGAGMDIGPYER